MYPYPLIFVGSTHGLIDLDRAIACSAAKLAGRCLDLNGLHAILGKPGATPHVLIVRLAGDDDLELLKQINDAYPGSPIVALIEGECDPRTYFAVSRAGAAQIVPIPWSKGDLEEALRRLTVQFGQTQSVARLIAVCGVSEGAGATCLALNIASELAAMWTKECILAEPAVPFGRLASYLNLPLPKSSEDLFIAGTMLDLPTVQKALTAVSERLRLLVSSVASLPAQAPPVDRVVAVVDNLRRLAQVVVLDMPYTFDETCFELLARADDVLLVCTPFFPSLQALQVVREALRNRRMCGEQHIVLNRYGDGTEDIDASRLQSLLQIDDVHTVRSDSSGFRKSLEGGGTLRRWSPRSGALADINRIVDTLFGSSSALPHRSIWSRLFGSWTGNGRVHAVNRNL